MAKQIPNHPQGWTCKGGCGDYKVWHAGKNDYRITKGCDESVIATADQFGSAFSKACRMSDADAYYRAHPEMAIAAATPVH